MRKYTNGTIVCTLIVLGAVVLILSCSFKKPDYSKWMVTVAYISHMWEFGGGEVSYRYEIGGNSYENYVPMPSGTVFGDRFIVLYNPKNPSESIIGSPNPYFLKEDSVSYTEGEIIGKTNHHLEKDGKEVFYFGYFYFVGNRKFTRSQNSFFCKKLNVQSLKSGMKFKVKYSLNNPQSSIMILDDSGMYILREIPCNMQPKLPW